MQLLHVPYQTRAEGWSPAPCLCCPSGRLGWGWTLIAQGVQAHLLPGPCGQASRALAVSLSPLGLQLRKDLTFQDGGGPGFYIDCTIIIRAFLTSMWGRESSHRQGG